jgi:hypothetical protein
MSEEHARFGLVEGQFLGSLVEKLSSGVPCVALLIVAVENGLEDKTHLALENLGVRVEEAQVEPIFSGDFGPRAALDGEQIEDPLNKGQRDVVGGVGPLELQMGLGNQNTAARWEQNAQHLKQNQY